MNTNKWKEVSDPEELFRLKREGWEIEFFDPLYACWLYWDGKSWFSNIKYRSRPKQPKMKKVKMLAFIDQSGELRWKDSPPLLGDYTSVPTEDKEIEVPDDM